MDSGQKCYLATEEVFFETYLNQGSCSTGCRTRALASARATAYSAWACMAARVVCRRKVCGAAAGAAPQDAEPQEVQFPGPAELHVVGLDFEGPDQKNAA